MYCACRWRCVAMVLGLHNGRRGEHDERRSITTTPTFSHPVEDHVNQNVGSGSSSAITADARTQSGTVFVSFLLFSIIFLLTLKTFCSLSGNAFNQNVCFFTSSLYIIWIYLSHICWTPNSNLTENVNKHWNRKKSIFRGKNQQNISTGVTWQVKVVFLHTFAKNIN